MHLCVRRSGVLGTVEMKTLPVNWSGASSGASRNENFAARVDDCAVNWLMAANRRLLRKGMPIESTSFKYDNRSRTHCAGWGLGVRVKGRTVQGVKGVGTCPMSFNEKFIIANSPKRLDLIGFSQCLDDCLRGAKFEA